MRCNLFNRTEFNMPHQPPNLCSLTRSIYCVSNEKNPFRLVEKRGAGAGGWATELGGQATEIGVFIKRIVLTDLYLWRLSVFFHCGIRVQLDQGRQQVAEEDVDLISSRHFNQATTTHRRQWCELVRLAGQKQRSRNDIFNLALVVI